VIPGVSLRDYAPASGVRPFQGAEMRWGRKGVGHAMGSAAKDAAMPLGTVRFVYTGRESGAPLAERFLRHRAEARCHVGCKRF